MIVIEVTDGTSKNHGHVMLAVCSASGFVPMSFNFGWHVEVHTVWPTTRRCPPGIMASDITGSVWGRIVLYSCPVDRGWPERG